MTISEVVKSRIISLHLAGRGRNELVKLLRQQGISVSEGSAGNIIREYKLKHERAVITSTVTTSAAVTAITSTTTTTTVGTTNTRDTAIKDTHTIVDTGSPFFCSSTSGGGLKPVLKNSGAPLSFFVTANDSVLGSPADVHGPVLFPIEESCNIEAAAQPQQQKELMNAEDVLEPDDLSLDKVELETSMQVEKSIDEKLEPEELPVPEVEAETIESKLEQGRKMWDCWTRVSNQISKEKDQRRHQLFLMDRKKVKLEEWRKRLEQMQYDLTTREGRILESEAFLPLAKQLQEMKLTLEDALPWIETIRENAEVENVDIRTAACTIGAGIEAISTIWGTG